MLPQTFEGTWEEIVQHASELAGHRVRVIVLDKAASPIKPFPPGTSLAELMKDYIGSVSSPHPHNNSERVEEIFGEGVLEKHRKTQKREP